MGVHVQSTKNQIKNIFSLIYLRMQCITKFIDRISDSCISLKLGCFRCFFYTIKIACIRMLGVDFTCVKGRGKNANGKICMTTKSPWNNKAWNKNVTTRTTSKHQYNRNEGKKKWGIKHFFVVCDIFFSQVSMLFRVNRFDSIYFAISATIYQRQQKKNSHSNRKK